jgi:hypothetical protein
MCSSKVAGRSVLSNKSVQKLGIDIGSPFREFSSEKKESRE